MNRPKVREVLVKVVLMDAEYTYSDSYIAEKGLADPAVYAAHVFEGDDLRGDPVVGHEVVSVGELREITDEEAEEMCIDLRET